MNNILNFLFLALILNACTVKNKPVQTSIIDPVLITDSLYTSMPGNLMLCDDYLVWFDPFAVYDFLKVIDLKTGKQIAQTGNKGMGPLEFMTPTVHISSGNNIMIADLNSKKLATLSIDNLVAGRNCMEFRDKTNFKRATRIVQIDDDRFLGLYPEKKQPFKVITKKHLIAFGKYPIVDPISNGYNTYQGVLKYNREKELLVYSIFFYPYLAVYRKSGDVFELKHEKTLVKPDYTISHGEMKIKDKMVLISELTLTKDYIVAAQKKEYKKRPKEQNLSEDIPKTLYVYDYKLNLVKIIDTKIPIMRLASNEKSNLVYAIAINPEYCIVKIDLE
ncbi:MAG: BF3164 family lipoprotein [Paludibacter sp.]|nr:BF3164 family lipoprotein [Paludibacter sp.]